MIDIDIDFDVDYERLQCFKSQLRSHWCHHPIGLLYLASVVRESFPDIAIRVFHTITSNNPIGRIESLITEFNPNLVGLRSLSIEQAMFKRIARRIRELKQDVYLIAGGPYPSSSYQDLVSSSYVDMVVIGEGEKTFVDVIQQLRSNRNLPLNLPGTAVVENDLVQVNKPQPPITDIDAIPFPSYDLINLKDYDGMSNNSFQDTSKSAFLFASRGCPYRCFYCHQLFGNKVRRRSAENVVSEMRQHVERRGIQNFVFVDDVFNVPQEKAKQTLSLIAKELPGVRINFPNGMRSDQMDDEFIDLLEQAGTVHVATAIETANSRLQKLIGKNLNIAKAAQAIDAASRRFIVSTYFMIGFPTETHKDAMETVSLAENLGHVSVPNMSVVRVYRGTSFFEMLQPNEEQALALADQERGMLQPKMFGDLNFYGDVFPKEKVPLRGQDIEALRWEWMRRVFNNPDRVKNSYKVIQKHLNNKEILEFYRNVYDNPKFNEKSLKRLLKQ